MTTERVLLMKSLLLLEATLPTVLDTLIACDSFSVTVCPISLTKLRISSPISTTGSLPDSWGNLAEIIN